MADDKIPGSNDQTFEEQVNSVVDKFEKGTDGTYALPEEVKGSLDEATLYAVNAEKRRRDTQSAFTKSQQELKRTAAENEQLRNRWRKDAVNNLPADQRDELDTLKHTDPDAWKAKLDEINQAASEAFDAQLDTINKEVSNGAELERRAKVLEDFQTAFPDIVLNDDIIDNDIPPRFTKQLEKGEITFEAFLEKCAKFITGNKVMEKGAKGEGDPTLQDVGGGAKPSDEDIGKSIKTTYAKEVF